MLGGPLPHQLQSDMGSSIGAFLLSSLELTRYCLPFPVHIPLQWVDSHTLLTRLTLKCIATFPFDLHVLWLPPALVLSKDQTLKI